MAGVDPSLAPVADSPTRGETRPTAVKRSERTELRGSRSECTLPSPQLPHKGSSVDLKSTFVKRFGDLVALLRADPGNDAAQDLALTAAAAAVAEHPVEVEAGVEWSVIPDDLTLKGRLLARSVDHVRISAGAEPHELLALARALAHDLTPLPSTPNVQVE